MPSDAVTIAVAVASPTVAAIVAVVIQRQRLAHERREADLVQLRQMFADGSRRVAELLDSAFELRDAKRRALELERLEESRRGGWSEVEEEARGGRLEQLRHEMASRAWADRLENALEGWTVHHAAMRIWFEPDHQLMEMADKVGDAGDRLHASALMLEKVSEADVSELESSAIGWLFEAQRVGGARF